MKPLLPLTIVLSSILLFFTSCTTTAPETVTYVLPNPPIKNGTSGAAIASITVRDIDLAEYINQGGFVMKNSSVEITITKQNRWGESLEKGIERYLNRLLKQQTSTAPSSTDTYDLEITFDAFESENFDHAVATGSWSIYPSQESSPTAIRSFHITQPITSHDYAGLVNAYSKILDHLAEEIQSEL